MVLRRYTKNVGIYTFFVGGAGGGGVLPRTDKVVRGIGGETTPSLTAFEPPLRRSGFVPTLRRSGLRRDKEDPAFVGLVDAKWVGTGVPAGPPQMGVTLCKSPLFFACRILVSLSLIGRGSPGTTIPTFTGGVDGAGRGSIRLRPTSCNYAGTSPASSSPRRRGTKLRRDKEGGEGKGACGAVISLSPCGFSRF